MTVLQLISHTPGPAWVDGVSFREQPGVEHHLATMRGWLEGGHLVMGGPFLDADGGGVAIVRFARSRTPTRRLRTTAPSGTGCCWPGPGRGSPGSAAWTSRRAATADAAPPDSGHLSE